MGDSGLTLLIDFVAGKRLDIQELYRLRKWMAHPENRPVIDEWMNDAWKNAPEEDCRLTFEQLSGEINSLHILSKGGMPAKSRLLRTLLRIASVLIVPAVILTVYYFMLQERSPETYTEFIAPMGQKSEIVLPDSTHIWLNSASKLRYSSKFGQGERNVFLEGEAYFEVRRKERYKFTVSTHRVSVEVLGTKFNMRAYPDEDIIETDLLEGRVNMLVSDVMTNTGVCKLMPGEKAVYSLPDNSLEKTKSDFAAVIAWKNNRLVFDDDTFAEMVKKTERWYNVHILYDNSRFEGKRFTLELNEGESLEYLMQIIRKTFGISYKIEGQTVFLE